MDIWKNHPFNFNEDKFEFIQEDPDVLMRLQNPEGDEQITFLTTDGNAMAEDELYRVDNMGDQWFVIINTPLIEDKINSSIEKNSEEYGVTLARYLPLAFVIKSALNDISEKMEGNKQ